MDKDQTAAPEKKGDNNSLWAIFISFVRIGALTFGGGYAMLPLLQREAVERRKWITEEEMMDYYAVSQCLPGIITINTSTFVGRKVRGNAGGIMAALGATFPSLVILILVAAFLKNFIEEPIFQNAFFGIRVAVAALIVEAIWTMWKKGVKDIPGVLIFAGAFVLSEFVGTSPIFIILGAVVLGIAISFWKTRKKA